MSKRFWHGVLAAPGLMQMPRSTPPWRPSPGSTGEGCSKCREDFDNCACEAPTHRSGGQ